MTKFFGSITCRCGDVSVGLVHPEPTYHTLCHCKDCRTRFELMEKLGGQAMPEGMRDGTSGVENVIFKNRLLVSDEARAKLGFLKLTAESDTTMMFSTCCGSVICGHAPKFAAGGITAPTAHTTQECAKVMPLMLTCFTSHIPAEKRAASDIPAEVPVLDGAEWDEKSMALAADYVRAAG